MGHYLLKATDVQYSIKVFVLFLIDKIQYIRNERCKTSMDFQEDEKKNEWKSRRGKTTKKWIKHKVDHIWHNQAVVCLINSTENVFHFHYEFRYSHLHMTHFTLDTWNQKYEIYFKCKSTLHVNTKLENERDKRIWSGKLLGISNGSYGLIALNIISHTPQMYDSFCFSFIYSSRARNAYSPHTHTHTNIYKNPNSYIYITTIILPKSKASNYVAH